MPEINSSLAVEPHIILVAKQQSLDYNNDDETILKNTIPVSLIQKSKNGPRRYPDGKLVPHSILGDIEDFEEMEFMISTDKPENIKIREENALKNWRHHSVDWNRTEQSIAKRSKKEIDQLLMARLGEYRQKIEEKDLIKEALLMLQQNSFDFWKCGLRIGTDLLGLTMPMPKGGIREIERVRTAKEFKSTEENFLNGKKEELKHIISGIDPFYGHENGGYMQVEGKSMIKQHALVKDLVHRLDNKFNKSVNDSFDKRTPKEEAIKDAEPETKKADTDNSPDILIPIKRLSFEVKLNEVAISTITIHNRGSSAYSFVWETFEAPNLFNIPLTNDGINRFYFYQKSGIVLPGTAFDFRIMFKSASPGIFTQIWKLKTLPPSLNSDLEVVLQGIAIEIDSNVTKRQNIEKLLGHKEGLQIAKDVIDLIIRNMNLDTDNQSYVKKENPDLILFEWSNRELALHYTSDVFSAFEDLVKSTCTHLGKPNYYWNRSVMTLYELINQIPNVDKRSSNLEKLNELISAASDSVEKRSRNSLLYMICYDIIIDISGKMCEISGVMRRKAKLPLQKGANFFPSEDNQDKPDEFTMELSRRGSTISNASPTKPAVASAAKKMLAKVEQKKVSNKKAEPEPIIDEPNKKKVKPVIDSYKTWSKERRSQESQYRAEFTIETPAAISRLKQIYNDNSTPKLLKIGTQKKGCSGQSYTLDYINSKGKLDETVEQDGIQIIIDSKALMSLIGSEMDYIQSPISSEFVFRNPNVKEMCGCGQSFMT